MNEIEKYQGFKAELAVAETYEELKLIETKASVLAELAKKNKVGLEEQNEWGKFRVEIEAKKGDWLDKKFPKGGEPKLRDTTLANEGITKEESVQARNILHNPNEVQDIIQEIIDSGKSIVTPSLVNTKLKQKKLETKKTEYIEQNKKEIITKPIIKIKDCVSFLSEFADNSIDLIFTDPPYSTDIDNITEFVNSWLDIAMQKTKPSGRVYICIGAYPIEIKAYLDVLLKQSKFIVDNPLIWSYKNTLGVTPKMKYNLNYQMIWHLYSNQSTELDTSITNEMFSVMEINAPDGRLGNRFHTWQKPDELARRLIRHSTKENDLVVDPFCCTGTFLLEACRLNRIAVGCDNSEENVLIAEKRGCHVQR